MRIDDLIAEAVERASQDSLVVPVAVTEMCSSVTEAELAEWLWEHREEFVGLKLQTSLARSRRASKEKARTRSFEKWAQQFSEGSTEEVFEIAYAVDPFGTHKPLGAMLGPDCRFVIEDRTSRSRAMAFDIALMRAVLKQLPDDETRVDQAFSAEQLAALFSTNQQAVLAAAA